MESVLCFTSAVKFVTFFRHFLRAQRSPLLIIKQGWTVPLSSRRRRQVFSFKSATYSLPPFTGAAVPVGLSFWKTGFPFPAYRERLS